MAPFARWPKAWLSRPVGRGPLLALIVVIMLAPAWLFGDVLSTYRLHMDDVAFVTGSRSLSRTLGHLFVPHNTHVIPVWRVGTWLLVSLSGRLANLQEVLAGASYAGLAAVMLMAGRLIARETGQATVALAAMIALGCSSVMMPAATWFSGSQTLWAGFGILATLWYLQGFRRCGGRWRLIVAAICTWLAAGCWTIGHAAGPVGAVYLWVDGRPRCRRVAWVPLAATIAAVIVSLSIGGERIKSTVSFGGRTPLEAAKPIKGVLHSLQAIPEELFFGNLGLTASVTLAQGAILTLAVLATWLWSISRRGGPNPLESSGLATVAISMFVEWTMRGYDAYEVWRGTVPWYNTIPQIGFILFLAGWWSGLGAMHPHKTIARPTWGQCGGLLALLLAALILHQPKVEALFQSSLPPLTAEEKERLPIPSFRHVRAMYLAEQRAAWQRHIWERLDQAEALAQREGISRDAIGTAFDRLTFPDPPEDAAILHWKHNALYGEYALANLLDLPAAGTTMSPEEVRRALMPFLLLPPDPAHPGAFLDMLQDRGILLGPRKATRPPAP